jgi:hypothetical protein
MKKEVFRIEHIFCTYASIFHILLGMGSRLYSFVWKANTTRMYSNHSNTDVIAAMQLCNHLHLNIFFG